MAVGGLGFLGAFPLAELEELEELAGADSMDLKRVRNGDFRTLGVPWRGGKTRLPPERESR